MNDAPRADRQGGEGVSTPFPIYTSHRLRGKRCEAPRRVPPDVSGSSRQRRDLDTAQPSRPARWRWGQAFPDRPRAERAQRALFVTARDGRVERPTSPSAATLSTRAGLPFIRSPHIRLWGAGNLPLTSPGERRPESPATAGRRGVHALPDLRLSPLAWQAVRSTAKRSTRC